MLHLDMTDSGPFMGVAVGAVLATMGGLLGGQIENRLQKGERQQSAALLFGEILAGLRLTLRLANDARGRGDPYGSVTLRIIKASQRETQVYDRNRETLFSVRDPKLRTETHILLAQMSLTIEAALEAAADLKALDKPDSGVDDPQEVARRRSEIIRSLDNSFEFVMELRDQLSPLIAQYEKLAGQRFAEPQGVLRLPAPSAGTEP